MHPVTMYELAKIKIAEEHAYAARQRLAHDAHRSVTFAGHTDQSLLERLTGVLRRVGRPSTRPAGGVA
jgi:hypothetical protein